MATLDAGTGAKVKAYSFSGPASYATGGFLLDASADFSWIGMVDLVVVTRGVLPAVDHELLLNRDLSSVEAFGKATIKLVRGRYDKATFGAVTGQPGGVTVQAAKTAAGTSTGSSHTHTINHDHPSVESADVTAAGTIGVLLAAAGGAMRSHTHTFDVPAFTGSAINNQHFHDRSFEYDHAHSLTTATADLTAAEIANATDLSGVSFRALVYGFGEA